MSEWLGDCHDSSDVRARSAVRAAIRVFGLGASAADWLGHGNVLFDGKAPIVVARDSEEGLHTVLAAVAAIDDARSN